MDFQTIIVNFQREYPMVTLTIDMMQLLLEQKAKIAELLDEIATLKQGVTAN